MTHELWVSDVIEPPPSTWQMIRRALHRRCPRCGSDGLFRRWLHRNPHCPGCGYTIERDDDTFLGAYLLNLMLTLTSMFLVLIFVVICVFGSYLVSGGSIEPLVEALPFELWTIGGAAIGTFLMANSMHDVKHTLGGLGKCLKGASFRKPDYIELLSLLYFLVRLASTKGSMAVEPHIEKPNDSAAFQKWA